MSDRTSTRRKAGAPRSQSKEERPSIYIDRGEVRLKLLKWTFFEIIFALLPLAFNWADSVIHGLGANAAQVLGRGELLLVSVAIIAAAIGDLVKGGLGTTIRGWKISLIGVGVILISGATWLYAEAAVPVGQKSDINVPMIVWISIGVAISSILTSVGCLVAAEVK